MFAYLKEYPHPPGSLLQNELNSDIARFTAHKKKKTLEPLYLL